MPGSSTTPGRPGARAYAPGRIAFHLRNSVGTRDMNLCGAQWLAYVLPYRRFAAVLTGGRARLGADVGRYSVITSDLHRLLVAGLPAHCEDSLRYRHSSDVYLALPPPNQSCDTAKVGRGEIEARLTIGETPNDQFRRRIAHDPFRRVVVEPDLLLLCNVCTNV